MSLIQKAFVECLLPLPGIVEGARSLILLCAQHLVKRLAHGRRSASVRGKILLTEEAKHKHCVHLHSEYILNVVFSPDWRQYPSLLHQEN